MLSPQTVETTRAAILKLREAHERETARRLSQSLVRAQRAIDRQTTFHLMRSPHWPSYKRRAAALRDAVVETSAALTERLAAAQDLLQSARSAQAFEDAQPVNARLRKNGQPDRRCKAYGLRAPVQPEPHAQERLVASRVWRNTWRAALRQGADPTAAATAAGIAAVDALVARSAQEA